MSKDNILISVIVPIYNVEPYLSKCIESILKQTYTNLQILLIDDGSTDASGKICDWYALLDQRVEVYHKENCGLVEARITGLNFVRGEYVGFVDGDDYVDEVMYEELLECLIENNADFVHSGYWEEKDNNKKTIMRFDEQLINIENKQVDFICENVLLNVRNTITYSIWSKLYKTELIKKSYCQVPRHGQYGEDLISLCACIFEANSIVLKKKQYYHYVVRTDSMTHINSIEKFKKEYELYQNLCELFGKYNCLSQMEQALYGWGKRHMTACMKAVYGKVIREVYYYQQIEQIKGKKIILYGAGKVGNGYYQQIRIYPQCNIVAWVDQNPNKSKNEFEEVIGTEKITTIQFDLVLIAVKKSDVAIEIRHDLINRGVNPNKIIWHEPKCKVIMEME